mmetsp:Transcript_37021/g.98627  ORF Transcript_37021/g.98627 Transcript_37021/m.98627 type:complete len:107 (+) Transcript_37021:761-1081(+)
MKTPPRVCRGSKHLLMQCVGRSQSGQRKLKSSKVFVRWSHPFRLKRHERSKCRVQQVAVSTLRGGLRPMTELGETETLSRTPLRRPVNCMFDSTTNPNIYRTSKCL